MRRYLAKFLHGIADRIYDDERTDRLIVLDEWDIVRCRVDIAADDNHGLDSEFDELPLGWHVHAWRGDEQYK